MRGFYLPDGKLQVILIIALCLSVCASALHARDTQKPRELSVVATIPPLHSLASALLLDVAEPALMIKGARSPHEFTIRPSEMETLSNADLVLRIDRTFEAGLARPMSRLGDKVPILSLMRLKNIRLRPFRGSAIEAPHSGHESHEASHAHHGHADSHGEASGHGQNDMSRYDPHLWLDLDNARLFVRHLADMATTIAPEFKDKIRVNLQKIETQLKTLDADLRSRLTPVQDKPFLTFHDAYQYLSLKYGLRYLGSVASDAHLEPGARHLSRVRNLLKEGKVVCLFTEPQFPPKLAHRLVSGTPARIGMLDPLGADIEPGPDQYFTTMRKLADNLAACLS